MKSQFTSILRPSFGTDWRPNTLILDQNGHSRVTCTLLLLQFAMKTAIHEQPAHWFRRRLATKYSNLDPNGDSRVQSCNLHTFTAPFGMKTDIHERTGFSTNWGPNTLILAPTAIHKQENCVRERSGRLRCPAKSGKASA